MCMHYAVFSNGWYGYSCNCYKDGYFSVGSRVLAKNEYTGVASVGKVAEVHKDGTYHIYLDDMEHIEYAEKRMITSLTRSVVDKVCCLSVHKCQPLPHHGLVFVAFLPVTLCGVGWQFLFVTCLQIWPY